MSQEVFDENRQQITTEVNTILAAKGKTRRRFRIIAIYEKATGDLVAEVFRTSLGPVVVSLAADAKSFVPNFEEVVGFRQDRTQRDIEPLTGDPRQPFFFSARERKHHFLWATHILDRFSPGDLLTFSS